MSPASVALPEPAADARETAPAAPRPTRPLYWSVRRELWENRSVYLAPLAVVVFMVVALAVHGVAMPSHLPGMLGTDPAQPGSASIMYRMLAVLLMATAFVTGAFYCIEALHGERRDRSILFWKSLPVSDRTAVLAKAAVPLVVLPLVTLAAIVALHLALALLSTVALVAQGQGAGPLWRELHLPGLWRSLLYAVPAAALWHAPVYAFLLLVSGWAKRAAALWAVLPLFVAGALEPLTMGSTHVASLLRYALIGWYRAGFAPWARERVPFHPLSVPAPGSFLAAPGLWIGLALAALFLAAAVRLRRQRSPM